MFSALFQHELNIRVFLKWRRVTRKNVHANNCYITHTHTHTNQTRWNLMQQNPIVQWNSSITIIIEHIRTEKCSLTLQKHFTLVYVAFRKMSMWLQPDETMKVKMFVIYWQRCIHLKISGYFRIRWCVCACVK